MKFIPKLTQSYKYSVVFMFGIFADPDPSYVDTDPYDMDPDHSDVDLKPNDNLKIWKIPDMINHWKFIKTMKRNGIVHKKCKQILW